MHFEPALSVFPLLLLLSSVAGQCLMGDDSPRMMNPASKRSLVDARFVFALDSLKKTAVIEPRENIFFSPHSLHQAITLAYFGARGNTEESLRKALRVPNDLSKVDVQRFHAYENAMGLDIQSNATDYEYKSANRLWITDTKKLRECMLDFFGDQLEKTDFHTNPTGVRDRINEWVSNMTKGHIRDLLPPGSIDEMTDLVLANAVYFKGLWKSRFDSANSKRDIFYSSGSQNSMVTFMHQKENFNHVISESLGAHILELPYKGDEISMFVMLPPFATARSMNSSERAPSDRDGVRQLIERISTPDGSKELRDMLNYGLPPRRVEVYLPRFEMERDLPVRELLYALGAGELMAPNSADLRGFLKDGEGTLHLGDAVHRARIEVNEEGTTAAAATALLSFRSGRPLQPPVFNANHPFVYFIYNKPLHTLLFAGVFRAPPQSTTA